MRCAATKAMSDIVEERQRSRCPPAAAPLRAAACRLAGFVARSSHTAPGIARRSRLASGPGGLQQNVKLFLREYLRRTAASQLVLLLLDILAELRDELVEPLEIGELGSAALLVAEPDECLAQQVMRPDVL